MCRVAEDLLLVCLARKPRHSRVFFRLFSGPIHRRVWGTERRRSEEKGHKEGTPQTYLHDIPQTMKIRLPIYSQHDPAKTSESPLQCRHGWLPACRMRRAHLLQHSPLCPTPVPCKKCPQQLYEVLDAEGTAKHMHGLHRPARGKRPKFQRAHDRAEAQDFLRSEWFVFHLDGYADWGYSPCCGVHLFGIS